MTVKELTINTVDIGEINVIVNEYTRKEIKQLIAEWIENIEFCETLNQNPDMYIFVEYNDGTTYSRSYNDENGTFKKTGIKAVEMDDGYEYYTFGEYEFNEYGVLTVA
jgi:hypothetical protein